MLISILVPLFLLCIYAAIEAIVLKCAGISTDYANTDWAWMNILQASVSLIVFGGGAILSACLVSNKPFAFLHADRGIGGKDGVPWKLTLLCCVFLLTALPFVSVTTQLNEMIKMPASLGWLQEMIDNLEKEAEQATTLFVTGKSVWVLLTEIVVMAIIPGVVEELCFRGQIQGVMMQLCKSRHVAVWVTAAFFSFIHFQFAGFIPRMVLGAVLGYILLYTGSVWVNAIAHALNNTLAVIVLWFTVNWPEIEQVKNVDMDHMELSLDSVAFALAMSALCIYIYKRLKNNKYIKEMEKRKVAIVCGGYSSEFGVSLKSAAGIKSFLDPERYNSTVVVIEKERWYAKPSEKEEFDIDKNDFSYTDAGGVRHTFDFAYITIHGTPGENGILQGYFELIGMKYSCCGPLAASVSFNKFVCNRYLQAFGAKIAKSVLLRAGEEYDAANIEAELGLPMFVKSNVGGSSFGVTKVKESKQIVPAIKRAFEEGDEVIIESFMKGTEITCGMYKTKNKCVVFPITEVVTSNEFFDYDAKYNGQVQEITPARLSPEVTKDVQEQTKKYYSLLGCKGIVRIDYIIIDGVPHVLEANTTPGMTATSFVPQQVRAAGLDIKEVMTDIIENEFSIVNS